MGDHPADAVPFQTLEDVAHNGWFTRYHPSTRNPEVVTTQWEFGVDGLTEDEAVELDQQFQTLVAEVERRHSDGRES